MAEQCVMRNSACFWLLQAVIMITVHILENTAPFFMTSANKCETLTFMANLLPCTSRCCF